MKQLKFQHDFATDIKDGKRKSTLRIDDKGIRVGERVQLIDKVSSNKPQQWVVAGELKIIGVQEFSLANLPLDLLKESEIGNNDKDELIIFLKRFYGERINDETIIKLITFDFDEYSTPAPYMLVENYQKDDLKSVLLYADGGSRGNPGPSASGFVIKDSSGKVVESWNKYLGVTTNNQAEYHGLLAGLEWCSQRNILEVDVRLDSLLVINQMKGIYKVKNRDLWTLYEAAKKLQTNFKKISFTHVPRELNKLADAEVNKALDALSEKDILQ